MDRRDVFKILGAGLIAQPALPAVAYSPRFFSKDEYSLVERLCEAILPADEHSAGAREAGVAWYLDTTLHYGPENLREQWRRGLEALEAHSREQYEKAAMRLEPPQIHEVLTLAARNETSPSTPLGHFFVLLKRSTIEGYYLSDTGARRELGYRGDTAVHEFKGCPHPGHHQEPA